MTKTINNSQPLLPGLSLWSESDLQHFARALFTEFYNEILERQEAKAQQPAPFADTCTRKEAADLLHVSLVSVHSLMNRGAITFRKVGRRTLIDRADLLKKIESGELAKYKHE